MTSLPLNTRNREEIDDCPDVVRYFLQLTILVREKKYWLPPKRLAATFKKSNWLIWKNQRNLVGIDLKNKRIHGTDPSFGVVINRRDGRISNRHLAWLDGEVLGCTRGSIG